MKNVICQRAACVTELSFDDNSKISVMLALLMSVDLSSTRAEINYPFRTMRWLSIDHSPKYILYITMRVVHYHI